MEEIQGIFYTLRKEATNKDPGSFYLGSNGYSGRILCDGIGWNLKKGTPLRVCGEWINRSILHFSVTEIYFDTTQGSACESFFSRSYFKGCGSTSSRMLYSRLCEDKGFKWNEIPVADLAELIRKYHVNEQAIHALAEAIGGIEERKRLRADLKAFEPTYRDLEILYQSYHHGAMVQLKERPYDCLAYGVSFQVCDGVAGEFGNLKAWDVDRITAIHRQLAKKVQSTGSCCIRIDLAIKYLSWLQRNSKFQELSPAFCDYKIRPLWAFNLS